MSLVVIVGVNTGHYHHDDNHGHCYAQRPVIILMSYTCFHPYYYTSVTQSSTFNQNNSCKTTKNTHYELALGPQEVETTKRRFYRFHSLRFLSWGQLLIV